MMEKWNVKKTKNEAERKVDAKWYIKSGQDGGSKDKVL